MSMAQASLERRLGRQAGDVRGQGGTCLEEAWMLLACQGGSGRGQPVAPGLRQAREPHVGRRDSVERRKRHPAVVSRLRAAQRFSGPERRDVPHA
jgi:hypothetical protein